MVFFIIDKYNISSILVYEIGIQEDVKDGKERTNN